MFCSHFDKEDFVFRVAEGLRFDKNLDDPLQDLMMCDYTCLEILKRWRLWIRPAVLASYVLVLLVAVPILVVKAADNGFKTKDQASIISGAFVMLAVPISIWGITQHLVYYNKPKLQKHLIRVLWMVPVYAMNAVSLLCLNFVSDSNLILPVLTLIYYKWLGMLYPQWSIYLDSGRECYEAYVIYNFLIYLFNYLNEETNFVETLEYKPQVNHFFPMCCLPTWEMGWDFIHNCKHGILQYTVFRPVTTGISFICEMIGVYHEGEWRWDGAFPYIMAINNFSQFIAMYSLFLFYKANKEELKPMKPVGKFLCIKAVVFFSFFQGFMISLLVSFGVLSSVLGTSNTEDLKGTASRIQNFLICIEMFLAAVAHHFTFSYKPFVISSSENKSCCEAFLAMWDVSDVHSDIKEHLEVVGTCVSRHIRGRGIYKSYSESARLLQPDTGSSYSSTYASSPHANSAPPRLLCTSVSSLDSGNGGSGETDVTLCGDDDDFIDLSIDCEEPKTNKFNNQNNPIV